MDIARGAITASEEDQLAALPCHGPGRSPGVLGTGRIGIRLEDMRCKAGSPRRVLPHRPGSGNQVEAMPEVEKLGQSPLSALSRNGHRAAAARLGEDLRTIGTLEADRAAHSRDRVDDQPDAPAMIASHSISTR
jgi:hypothetical protein